MLTLTLDEAIRVLKGYLNRELPNTLTDAIKLGIEALEEVKHLRLRIPLRFQRPLEGETEEKPKKPGLPLKGIIISIDEETEE